MTDSGLFEHLQKTPCFDAVHSQTSCLHATSHLFVHNLKIASAIFVPATLAFDFSKKKTISITSLVDSIKNGIKSGLWMSIWVPGFNALMCSYYNRYGAHSKLATFSAGFLSGFASSEINPNPIVRKRIMLYLLNNAIESAWKMMEGSGILKSVRNGECLVFAISLSLLSWIFHSHSSHANLVKVIGAYEGIPSPKTDEEKKALSLIHPKIDALLRIPKSFVLSEPGYVLQGTTKALLIGVIIKILGSVVTLLKAALSKSSPANVAQSTPSTFASRNGLILFLTCSTAIYRILRVMLKKIVGEDSPIATLVPGFVAGLTTVFYPSVVVSQLILSQAIDALWNVASSKGMVTAPVKGVSIMNGLASAVLLYAATWNPANLRASTAKMFGLLSSSNLAKPRNIKE